jgi:hypothetical protein
VLFIVVCVARLHDNICSRLSATVGRRPSCTCRYAHMLPPVAVGLTSSSSCPISYASGVNITIFIINSSMLPNSCGSGAHLLDPCIGNYVCFSRSRMTSNLNRLHLGFILD